MPHLKNTYSINREFSSFNKRGIFVVGVVFAAFVSGLPVDGTSFLAAAVVAAVVAVVVTVVVDVGAVVVVVVVGFRFVARNFNVINANSLGNESFRGRQCAKNAKEEKQNMRPTRLSPTAQCSKKKFTRDLPSRLDQPTAPTTT